MNIYVYMYIYTPFYIQTHVYAYYVRICIYYIYIIRIFDMFATFSSRKIWKPRSEPWTLRRPVSVPSVAWRRRARRSDTEWYKGNKVCVCVSVFYYCVILNTTHINIYLCICIIPRPTNYIYKEMNKLKSSENKNCRCGNFPGYLF